MQLPISEGNAANCGMEINDNKCKHYIISYDHKSFLLPKTHDYKIHLEEISVLEPVAIKINSKIHPNIQVCTNNLSPPIYLAVSSFLI